jgi:predicted hydrocarbon binding protein
MDADLARLHAAAYFVGALAHGAEKNLGRGCNSVCNLAGKRFGLEAVQDVAQTSDPLQAVEVLRQALTAHGLVWDFEPFVGASPELVTEENGKHKLRLVFRTCMVRNALFCYAHEQKQSLCYMAHGVFAGAMERIMPNTRVHLEITQAGPNACLKEMTWEVVS